MNKKQKNRSLSLALVRKKKGKGVKRFFGKVGKYLRPLLGSASDITKNEIAKFAKESMQNSASALTQLALNKARGGRGGEEEGENLNKTALPDEILALNDFSSLNEEVPPHSEIIEISKKKKPRKRKKHTKKKNKKKKKKKIHRGGSKKKTKKKKKERRRSPQNKKSFCARGARGARGAGKRRRMKKKSIFD